MPIHRTVAGLLRCCSLAVLLGAGLGVPHVAHGQGTGRVTGVVADSAGIPILGAEVTLAGTTISDMTDERGEFRLDRVPQGDGTVRVRRLGFFPKAVGVSLASGQKGRGMSISLERVTQMLAPVVVQNRRVSFTGRLGGYYERLAKRSGGHFITREEIDRMNPRMLSQLLSRLPSVSARGIRAGGQGVRMRGRQCWPLVWLDGVPMPAGDVDVDAFPPNTIHGIEVYLGATGAPMKYTMPRGYSSCGTILLWSRGPDTDPILPRLGQPRHLESLVASISIFTADSVDQQAALPAGQHLEVTYPPALFAAGTPGRVVAEFVVDASGRVEPGTFGIVSSTHPLFSEAVRQAVETTIYVPARRRGTAVRQVVHQPVDFAVRHRRGG